MLVDAQSQAASRFSLLNACVDEPLNSTECRHETWALDSNPFDCASLPICDITCGGPSVQVLRTAAQHCACSAEVAPRDDLAPRGGPCYFPRPPTFSFLDCGRALSVELAPPDGRRLRLRGVVRYRREPGRRRRLSSARARGPAAAPGVALCREVEGYWSGARPRGVGRAAGAVAAGFGVRAPLILRMVFCYSVSRFIVVTVGL